MSAHAPSGSEGDPESQPRGIRLPSSQTPTQFIALNLLGNLDFALQTHLVTRMEQCRHEVEIQAGLRSTLELFRRAFDCLEPRPRTTLLTFTHLGGQVEKLSDCKDSGMPSGFVRSKK